MPTDVRFEDLTGQQQTEARARFLGAGPGDGFGYETLAGGGVLCRRRLTLKRRLELELENHDQVADPAGPPADDRTSTHDRSAK